MHRSLAHHRRPSRLLLGAAAALVTLLPVMAAKVTSKSPAPTAKATTALPAPAAITTLASDLPPLTLGTTLLGIPVIGSIFIDDFASGKDPFFPTSERRVPKTAIASRPAVRTSFDANRIQLLTLKGITGPADQRIALINNMTFVVGETSNVRVTGGYLKVRLLEINDKTATLAIEGEPGRHELKLRDSTAALTSETRTISTAQK